MNKDPLVTIYITNHNYGKYIEKSIKSAINQSYENIEIIIVDDCSNDNSKKVLDKFINIKNVKFIFNSKKIGFIKSANKAIKISKGKYFIRLDADDVLKKKAIEKLVEIIKRNKNISMLFSNFHFFFENRKKIKEFKYIHKKNYSLTDFPAHGACSLIKRSAFKKIGGYSEFFDRQDGFYIWTAFLIKNFKIRHLKKSLFYYRIHDKNLSKNYIKILKERIKIISYFTKKNSKNKELILVKKKTQKELNNLR